MCHTHNNRLVRRRPCPLHRLELESGGEREVLSVPACVSTEAKRCGGGHAVLTNSACNTGKFLSAMAISLSSLKTRKANALQLIDDRGQGDPPAPMGPQPGTSRMPDSRTGPYRNQRADTHSIFAQSLSSRPT